MAFEYKDSIGPRLYDTHEPNVIDEPMLREAVEEQGPKNEAGIIARKEGIDFLEVRDLRLDFRDILKIDNLWYFKNLTKLQLDNNIIEKIEGLEVLVNLIWLDLSFNNIEVIEGISHLTKLEDLTFFHNRIQTIEGMDGLNELHVLSLGNNDILRLENTLYLRKFKKLRALNLEGNPIAEQTDEYRSFVIAHLPNLEYLDYRLIDSATRKTAHDKHYVSVEELAHDERAAERKLQEENEKLKEIEKHKLAYVEGLNGPQLFDMMYSEDGEGKKLNEMPGMEDILVGYREKFASVCQQIFDFGIQEQEKRSNEVKQFWDAIGEAKQENDKKGEEKITEFMEYKIALFDELGKMGESEIQTYEAKLIEYKEKVNKLKDILMGLEVALVDQLEDTVKEFDQNLSEMVGAFLEHVQGLTAQLRELEANHHEKVMELAIVTLERVIKNELDDEISDELRELFVDKDTIIAAVTTSHDWHLLKLDHREDDLKQKIQSWLSSLIDKIHEEEEFQRNRKRVAEIANLIEHLNEEAENLDISGGYI